MNDSSEEVSLNELIMSFHAGTPWLAWIRFNDNYGEHRCTECSMAHKTLVMTSPNTGICDGCWDRMQGG